MLVILVIKIFLSNKNVIYNFKVKLYISWSTCEILYSIFSFKKWNNGGGLTIN